MAGIVPRQSSPWNFFAITDAAPRQCRDRRRCIAWRWRSLHYPRCSGPRRSHIAAQSTRGLAAGSHRDRGQMLATPTDGSSRGPGAANGCRVSPGRASFRSGACISFGTCRYAWRTVLFAVMTHPWSGGRRQKFRTGSQRWRSRDEWKTAGDFTGRRRRRARRCTQPRPRRHVCYSRRPPSREARKRPQSRRRRAAPSALDRRAARSAAARDAGAAAARFGRGPPAAERTAAPPAATIDPNRPCYPPGGRAAPRERRHAPIPHRAGGRRRRRTGRLPARLRTYVTRYFVDSPTSIDTVQARHVAFERPSIC